VEIAKREPVKRWSSLNDDSINISGQVVSNGRYVAFQVADIVITTLRCRMLASGQCDAQETDEKVTRRRVHCLRCCSRQSMN
jgi:hypothetical protein